MKIPTLFKEYIWLIETINQAGRITFAEINEKWRKREEGGGLDFSRTTFNRHRDAILDMFGVIIECDRKDGYRYFIYNKEVLNSDSVANWLFSTLLSNDIMLVMEKSSSGSSVMQAPVFSSLNSILRVIT